MREIKKKLQKKPKFQPSSTKGLTLLMETKRRELELSKEKKEDIKREDEQRIRKQNEFNERVRKSAVIMKYNEDIKEMKNKFIEMAKKAKIASKTDIKNYKKSLEEMNQRISNRPLMMEEVVKSKPIKAMGEGNI